MHPHHSKYDDIMSVAVDCSLFSFPSDRSKHEESFLSSEEEEVEEVQPKINVKQQMAQRFGNDYVEELLGNENIGT